MSDESISQAQAWVEGARRVVALTGAGISTESGIPDFRGPQGLWTRNPAAEKMATIHHYLANPDIRKRSWQHRLATLERRVEPNAGHRALVDLERRGKLHTLITQNVDGLHHAAGSSPGIVIEIHGTMRDVICVSCGDRAPMERALERVRNGEDDPSCRRCGGILKSAAIFFGEGLVERDLRRAEAAARDCDLLLAIGTTLSVYPIAGIVPVAKAAGARLVIINAEATEMDHLADGVIRGAIGTLLPRLILAAGTHVPN